MSKISDIAAERTVLSASIIASDLSLMGAIAKTMRPDAVDMLHLDVMDGCFVPNLTFGPGYIKNLSANCSIPLDAHLMVENPEVCISSYLELNLWGVTVHYEATRFPARLLTLIRQAGKIAGLAVNPATPIEAVFDLLPFIDMLLVMSVEPGFYGQSFMPSALSRISRAAGFAKANGYGKLLIQTDGGIDADNAADVTAAGANVLVTGGALFNGNDNEDINERALRIKAAADINKRV